MSSPEELFEQYNMELAREIVAKMEPKLRRYSTALVHFQKALHLRTNTSGTRLSPEEIEVIKRNKGALERKMADIYTDGDRADLEIYLARAGVGNEYVKQVLLEEETSS